jgi:hypothetical protein
LEEVKDTKNGARIGNYSSQRKVGDDDDIAVRRKKFHRNSRSTARLGRDVGLVLNGEATANFLSLGYGTCGQYSFWANKGVIVVTFHVMAP